VIRGKGSVKVLRKEIFLLTFRGIPLSGNGNPKNFGWDKLISLGVDLGESFLRYLRISLKIFLPRLLKPKNHFNFRIRTRKGVCEGFLVGNI